MTDEPSSDTESRNPRSYDLDAMSAIEVVELMADQEHRATDAVAAVTQSLAMVAHRVADAYLGGHRTVVIGSGTSGMIALQEVVELPPTFGVAADNFVALVAMRAQVGPAAVAMSEDDTELVTAAIAQLEIQQGDVVIGIAASGRTPFVLAGISAARAAGAWCCGIANNRDSPLTAASDLAIVLDTGPEVLTGSTRLNAGTAQKLALNRITTTAMVRAGKVTSNFMTEMQATNTKLKQRAVTIVQTLCHVPEAAANDLLRRASWHIGDAIRLHRSA